MTTDADKGGRAHASLIGSVTALKLFEDGDQQYVQIKMRTAGAEVVVVARRAVFGSQFDRLGLGAGIEVRGQLRFEPKPRLAATRVNVFRMAGQPLADETAH